MAPDWIGKPVYDATGITATSLGGKSRWYSSNASEAQIIRASKPKTANEAFQDVRDAFPNLGREITRGVERGVAMWQGCDFRIAIIGWYR